METTKEKPVTEDAVAEKVVAEKVVAEIIDGVTAQRVGSAQMVVHVLRQVAVDATGLESEQT